MRVRVDDLAKRVEEEIRLQTEEVVTEINNEVKDLANAAAEKLKSTSPRSSGTGGRKGHYADGWKVKDGEKNMFGYISQTIYNAKKPQISHLLEHGHAKAGGVERVAGIQHIGPVEDELAKEIERLGK